MVKITQDEFQRNTIKLSYIIMVQMFKDCKTIFTDLNNHEKKVFNKKLNEYIKDLMDDTWEQEITSDFNEICNDYLFTSEFDPSKYVPSNKNNTDVRQLKLGEMLE